MKNIILLFVLSITLFSCSTNDDTVTPMEVEVEEEQLDDPNIISQYHAIDYNGEISSRYYFDRIGRIYKSHKLSEDFTLNYEFDDTNKLVRIDTKDLDENILSSLSINYDNNDRITSIGDRTFDYNETENFYTEFEYLNNDYDIFGDIEWVQNLYYRFTFQNDTNPIPQFCVYNENVYTNTSTGEVTISGNCDSLSSWHTRYINENVTAYGNEGSSYYEYDDLENPLFSSENNLPYVLGFLMNGDSYQYWFLYQTISKNKTISSNYEPEDPESALYLYNYNSIGLPNEKITQYYYVGQIEYEAISARYYYQGDMIPD